MTRHEPELASETDQSMGTTDLVGNSPAMREIFRIIRLAGPSNCSILIQGESGTGKELVAQALHRASRRAPKPLISINCAAIPDMLLESELFGHEKGAFTGALHAKPGLFELADGGTLFIDEVGEMPPALQAKLLRIVENGRLRRVGSIEERKIDVRLLAATNRNLEKEVGAGRFREDLFYRINVLGLQLPPLRDRVGDIALLVERFLGNDWQIEAQALACLNNYAWPGNIRQLVNVIERAKVLGVGRTIRLVDLPAALLEPTGEPAKMMTSQVLTSSRASDECTAETSDDLSICERQKVLQVLKREAFNKARAAQKLGISRRKLYRLLEKYFADGALIGPACLPGETQLLALDQLR